MFYDVSHFPAVAVLEENWREIREEFEALETGRKIAWPEKHLYENNKGVKQDEAWNVVPLYGFGRKIVSNCQAFVKTTAVIERVPQLASATFSVLEGGTHIAAHRGYDGYSEGVLRCHLGLICPPATRFRLGTETRRWEEGKVLVFDDMIEHEIWNDSDSRRVVLIVDFAVPDKMHRVATIFRTSPELASTLDELFPKAQN